MLCSSCWLPVASQSAIRDLVLFLALDYGLFQAMRHNKRLTIIKSTSEVSIQTWVGSKHLLIKLVIRSSKCFPIKTESALGPPNPVLVSSGPTGCAIFPGKMCSQVGLSNWILRHGVQAEVRHTATRTGLQNLPCNSPPLFLFLFLSCKEKTMSAKRKGASRWNEPRSLKDYMEHSPPWSSHIGLWRM